MSGSASDSGSGLASSAGSGSTDESVSMQSNVVESSSAPTSVPEGIFNGTGVTLVWEHVCATVKISTSRGFCKGSDVTERTILDDVSGVAKQGSVTFLMGPSGSGKTTTLNLLAGRAGASIERTGSVTLNGIEVTDDQFKSLASFVTQDDILLTELTPYEQVLFTARMHLGGVTDDERKRRVLDVLSFLGLTKCKDTVIGTPGLQRGISGGERKRVNIANSLITNPEILVLDEPTSGLDSETALSVIQVLCRLAKEGKTILATLHQPSVEMLELCDNLVLLSAGRVAYSGSYAALPAFFEDLGYDFPERRNPLDIAMNIITPSRMKDQDDEAARIDKVVAAAAEARSEASSSLSRGSSGDLPAVSPQPSVLARTGYLFARAFMVQAQSRVLTRARASQTVILGLVVGAIFWQLERGATGGSDRLGLLFLATINQFIVSLMGVIGTLPKERPVALREIASGSYSASMYFFSKAQADLPFQVLFPGAFATIIYWMAGLRNDAATYWIYIAAVITTANIGSSLGFFVSSMTGDTTVALAIAPATILPMLIFSGYLVRVHRIPGFLRWISYLNPFRYTLSILTQNELRGMVFSCPELPGGCLVKSGDQLLATQDLQFIKIWKAGVVLVAMFIAFRILGLVAMNLAVRRHKKTG